MEEKCVIEIINLSKKIDGLTILNNISMKCNEGEVIGIVGPNGAGKSSFFKILMGLWKASDGTIKFQDKCFESSYINGLIEEPALYPYLKVKELIQYCSKLNDVNIECEEVNQLIEKLDIKKFENKLCGKLSVGMKQRVGILQAMLNNPKILILDEPTNGLDIIGKERIYELIKVWKENGKTILISSHILEEINSICDHIIILRKGEVVHQLCNKTVSKECVHKYFI